MISVTVISDQKKFATKSKADHKCFHGFDVDIFICVISKQKSFNPYTSRSTCMYILNYPQGGNIEAAI